MKLVTIRSLASALAFAAVSSPTLQAQATDANTSAVARKRAVDSRKAAAEAAKTVESEPRRRFVSLALNPVALLGALSVDLAAAVLPNLALTGGFGVSLIAGSGYGGYGGAQIFLSSSTPFQGWFIYPQVGFIKVRESTETITAVDSSGRLTSASIGAEYSLIRGGLIGGYQWLWDIGFTLRIGAGIGYSHFLSQDTITTQFGANQRSESFVFADDYEGLLPMLDAAIGWTF